MLIVVKDFEFVEHYKFKIMMCHGGGGIILHRTVVRRVEVQRSRMFPLYF